MNNKVFGNMVFDTGFKTATEITLFNNDYNVVVKAKAYFEKDGVTAEQEYAFDDFRLKRGENLIELEMMLKHYSNEASTRFVPKVLLFNRDGSYALLLDDQQDEEGGIAACFAPKKEVLLQDDYL